MIDQYPKDSLAIIIDCGTEDRVLPMNKAVHEKMLKLKIPHDYTERPGEHNWAYWDTSIDYQLLFFRRHFDKMMKNITRVNLLVVCNLRFDLLTINHQILDHVFHSS